MKIKYVTDLRITFLEIPGTIKYEYRERGTHRKVRLYHLLYSRMRTEK